MVYMLLTHLEHYNLTKILTVLCIFPLVMVPYLLDKIKIYHMDEVVIFFYYIFLLLSLVLGSILDYYCKIWWFDLFTHFISGILTSIVAFIILQENHLIKSNNKSFCILFLIVFTIGIAGCWEYFEYICDKIFHADCQYVKETGVDDTMTDMLIATMASILVSIYYLYYIRKKEKGVQS